MEKFEITDYDLDNEFNPDRKRRKFTKNDAIYGVWNEDEVRIRHRFSVGAASQIDSRQRRHLHLRSHPRPCAGSSPWPV